MASEFSYDPSEDLNRAVSPEKRQHSLASQTSSRSKSSSSRGPRDPFGDFNAPPTKSMGRESYMSSLSEYSGRERDVAEPVTVVRVERNLGDVNKVELQSEPSLKLGKLPTLKGTPDRKLPDMSYNTNVEAPVPPRSSRRPKSAVYSQDVDVTNKGHKQLHSITEDLERLMLSATEAGATGTQEYDRPDDSSSKYSHSRKTTDTASPVIDPNEHFLPPRPSPTDVERARVVSQEIRQQELNEAEATKEPVVDQMMSPEATGNSENENWQHKGAGHPYRQSIASSNSAPSVPSVPYPQNDNDFYDIEEPTLVRPPARVKSVKESTHNVNKFGKKKTKKRVKSHASKSHLKPFTYSTLISLLESTNGTVIGEEFTLLNLPIRQKQLVEKIVDSLSRLTLDMLMDEQRYEIGIRRLEGALRVLEGFM